MPRILATVVLYNPPDNIVDNICTYADQVDMLLVIDNSEKSHTKLPELQGSFSSLVYVKNQQNLGIAGALNQAAAYAIKNGFDWLLTMDQDSRFRGGSIEALINAIDVFSKPQIGLFTPIHVNKDVIVTSKKETYVEIKKTMTSGNLLSMEAYKVCGSFNENLFIDYVDHDFNLRLRKLGFKIIQVNSSLLDHNLGDISIYRYLFFKIKTTNHNAIRRYYITRNRLYVIFTYFRVDPKFFFKELKNYWMELFKIVFFEQDKINKLRSIVKGTLDWIIGKYGILK